MQYYNETDSSVTANVAKNERKATKGIQLNSTVTVRWKLKTAQTIQHTQENQRVLEITHGQGESLALNWRQA